MTLDKKIKILVVDDEEGIREGCKRILLTEGYEVTTAYDGMNGWEIYNKNGGFDAVLIDMKMPRMGGLELIEKIHQQNEDTILFVITAYATINTAVEATKLGAYGYIPKPFTPDELLMHLNNGLEKRSLLLEAKQLREEREKSLLEVAYERSKSNTIINCMTDGILVVNKNRQIVLKNPSITRIIPSLSDITLPASLDDILIGTPLKNIIDEVLVSKECLFIASQEIGIDNCTYMVNACPVIESDEENLGAVAVLRDISALKKLEVAKSMFVSMVSHELKSPLSAIESYLALLTSGIVEDKEKQMEWMNKALIRCQVLRTLVSDLLNLTAIETGKFNLKRSPLQCGEIIESIYESSLEKAKEKNIKLEFECINNASPEPILADKSALTSICTNLVDNAIKYTPDGGSVRIILEHNGTYVKLKIKDTGIGLSAEEKEKIFEEFFRVKNSFTVKVPGTGLGLSLVKKLVELHNGRISVESKEGQGSEFMIRFPTVGNTFNN